MSPADLWWPPHETFRVEVLASARTVMIMHNYPSGYSNSVGTEILVKRDLVRAG
jgi:DNA repair protein RadC